ncbi:MAG: hypothetical protein CVT95_00915 [Bacteroidetes bacterium HGW-Bacteroidetes-12]|nr:MAG: hypothetical protein CVT95_00915 [Bacteroidetes bacterium HGW-Bacteroidetes-12]
MNKIFVILFLIISLFFTQKIYSQDFDDVQKIIASDRQGGDEYGRSVSIDGKYAIVGAWFEDHDSLGLNTLSNSGSAYIYKRDGNNTWSQVKKIVPPYRSANDYFGFSVSISGRYAIVGAYGNDEDANENNTITQAGAAYIYKLDDYGSWNFIQKIVASDRSFAQGFLYSDDCFGISVAISENYAVIGAYHGRTDENDNNPVDKAGSAYIFKRDTNGTWVEIQKIVAFDRAYYDEYGYFVDIDKNYIIVGARRKNNTTGAAYIYEKDSLGIWNLANKITASDGTPIDYFGISVSISKDQALVGTSEQPEAAYFFKRDSLSGNWYETQKVVSSDGNSGDLFGISVSIFENQAIIGSHRHDFDTINGSPINNAGAAYIFKQDSSGTWNEVKKIIANDRDSTATNDYFGAGINISEYYIIVGAMNEGGSGAAYIVGDCKNEFSVDTLNIVACTSYTPPSGKTTYLNSGTYIDTISNHKGCDSIITINLTVSGNIPTYYSYSTSSCDSYIVPSGDTSYIYSGVYYDTILNHYGCDSILTINLTINDSYIFNQNQLICQGDSILIYGNYQSIAGNYYDSLQTTNGCDSVLSTTLSVNPVYFSNTNDNICQGDSVIIYGNYENTAGVYYDTLQTIFSCDSVLATTLFLNANFNTSQNQEICQGDSIMLGGSYQTIGGVYYDSLQTINGCDSVLSTTLTVNSLPNVTLTNFNPDTICSNGSAVALPNGSPSGGVYSGTGVSGGTFDPNISGVGIHSVIYTYTDINSCINSDSTFITVEQCVGIDDFVNDLGILIYPNPNTGLFIIEKSSELDKEVNISLLDASSRVVIDKVIPKGQQKIEMDITSYSKGVYYLQMTIGDKVYVKQILKN